MSREEVPAMAKERTQKPLRTAATAGSAGKPGGSGRADAPKARAPKKAGTPLKGALSAVFVCLLLVGALGAALFFNLFQSRDRLIDALGWTDEAANHKQEQLSDWETKLNNDALTLASQQKDLKAQEEGLREKETEAVRREEELASQIEQYTELLAQLETKNNDIQTVIKAIEGMDAKAAAAMLMEMKDRAAMIALFSRLKQASKSAILEALDAKSAAGLAEDLTG
jgi:flagellar motility protein MotE (MotC chaperone)